MNLKNCVKYPSLTMFITYILHKKQKKVFSYRISKYIKRKFLRELAKNKQTPLKLESRFPFSGTTANIPYDYKHFLIGSMTIHLAVLGMAMPISSRIIITFLLKIDIMNI